MEEGKYFVVKVLWFCCVKCCSILEKRYATRYMNKIPQQDNTSCHCSRFTKKFLKYKKINILHNYVPCSPDLNIIENIWAILKDNVRRRASRNLDEFKLFVEEFNKIPDSLISNLYGTILKRISEVLGGIVV